MTNFDPDRPKGPHGRGTGLRPRQRFREDHLETFIEESPGEFPPDPNEPERPPTLFVKDASGSILSENDSPDLPYSFGLNPYRGCEHGCVYCYARPTHEYLGYGSGIEFETRILYKPDAERLLEKALAAPSWKPALVSMSGNTDCYQPVERKMGLTRSCLEVFARFRNPVSVITKNALVVRDLDLLQELASRGCGHVAVSVTTLDPALASRLEPRASTPKARLAAIESLSRAGIPVTAMIAPIIPVLTSRETPALLKAVREAGALDANYVVLRLPGRNDELFIDWLERHASSRKEKVLEGIRNLRGGALNDSGFRSRMRGIGEEAEMISRLFKIQRERLAFPGTPGFDFTRFRRPPTAQMGFFDQE